MRKPGINWETCITTAGLSKRTSRSTKIQSTPTRNATLSDDNLASIYIQKGCQAEAIPLLQNEIELSTDDTDTIRLWNQLGDAYRHLDDYEHAMAAYRNADALDPQKVSAPPEEATTEPDPQCTPSEDGSIQPDREFQTQVHAGTGFAVRAGAIH